MTQPFKTKRPRRYTKKALKDELSAIQPIRALEAELERYMSENEEPLADDAAAANLIVEYEKFDRSADLKFVDYQRYACFIHTYQLVVNI
ncbi:hypothetical protein RvY_11686 [Ramazzottius varieornatus]|uniref:Uncharacterized protein n=1 Tax=Ramazzottius varieornatus TaxID=947166 RepID=A0A1D1VIZ4_RAMVA|nr:hypothetical protein RvY_11686 [Ramazzottius varieornatus]